jgi:2-oxoglutarate ferredoxin oxidoreductase subunit alpha
MLVLGWGCTYGSIQSACDLVRREGHAVANIHLRHVWPLPYGLDEIFTRYKAILVPELNLGQMVRLLRSEYPSRNFISYPKIQGRPFTTAELISRITTILEQ